MPRSSPGAATGFSSSIRARTSSVFSVLIAVRRSPQPIGNDRGDAENNFDELKNQWGWLGYTTHDHARSEMMTLFVALVYNWWSLFTRLSNPTKRAEAITTRPPLLHAIGRKTSHSNQSTLALTSLHAEATK